ncbi:MAG: hypothetical protein IPG29_13880 [Sphingobacteriales bacterium]|nr:hypothetical protein [Sphingobacteriales bacterium]
MPPRGNYELTFTLTTPKAGRPDQSVQTITIQDAPTAAPLPQLPSVLAMPPPYNLTPY